MKHVLFIQGGGEEGYEFDKALVTSLKNNLGKAYDVAYPEIKPDESSPDYGWLRQIDNLLSNIKNEIIIVAHSFGASMLLKYLSEHSISIDIKGIFLIATPYWSGNEDWKKGLKLKVGFNQKISADIPLFFYQSMDDEEVSIDQFNTYQKQLPHATFRIIKTGGHQLNNDLSVVAKDIKSLQ